MNSANGQNLFILFIPLRLTAASYNPIFFLFNEWWCLSLILIFFYVCNMLWYDNCVGSGGWHHGSQGTIGFITQRRWCQLGVVIIRIAIEAWRIHWKDIGWGQIREWRTCWHLEFTISKVDVIGVRLLGSREYARFVGSWMKRIKFISGERVNLLRMKLLL